MLVFLFLHVPNYPSPLGFSDSNDRRPQFYSSYPWLWNFSRFSPEPLVSFCPDSYMCLSPVVLKSLFSLESQANFTILRTLSFVAKKKNAFLVSADLLGCIICLYSSLFCRVPLRETLIRSSSLLSTAWPFLTILASSDGPWSESHFCSGTLTPWSSRHTHTSIREMPLTQRLALGAVKFTPKKPERPCRNLFLIVKSLANPVTMHICIVKMEWNE